MRVPPAFEKFRVLLTSLLPPRVRRMGSEHGARPRRFIVGLVPTSPDRDLVFQDSPAVPGRGRSPRPPAHWSAVLIAALLTLLALPAQAQFTRDAAANKKIDEAINQHYVATDFEKAEGVLLGTINACADKCSPAVFSKAWMYVGIVRGSGRNNQAGAKEAFQKAVAADPNVKLDMVLATPETQATFNEVAGGGGGAAVAPVPIPGGETATPAGPVAGGLVCTPEPMTIETRRVIPVECKSDEEVTAMELRYKSFGSDKWTTVAMTKKGDAFRGEVPCTATKNVGPVKLYVRAKDAQGEEVDSWGKKTAPVEFQMAETGAGEPPSFSDADAPQRCQASEECPPDFPGCGAAAGVKRGNKDWGEACDNSTECKSGLLCQDGTCQTAPSCETNSDCETGTCVNGTCDIPRDDLGPAAAYKKNWLGIHVAQDFAIVGGSNVCDANLGQKSDNYACFYEGTSDEPFWHTPFPYKDGITTGSAVATTRVLLSYDRAFTPRLTLGARVGYAFRGGPPAGQTPTGDYANEDNLNDIPDHTKGEGGTPFLPVHAEIRGTFWILPLNAKLFRAYVSLGGGMAQVDAKVSVPERDCADTLEADWDANNGNFDECRKGDTSFNWKALEETKVDAWKKMGQGFATVALGGVLAFKDNMGVQLNVNVMYMLPASGIVFEPSLGFVYGL